MEKYYTPDVEEFYVGFEFESKRGAYDGTVKTQEQFDNEKWQYDFCSEGDLPYIERALTGTNAKNGLCHLRVKYLDREDIESLGFEIDADYKSINSVLFSKDDYTILQSDITEILISDLFNETTLFNGRIKNKSELKKLLKQLGI
jgi:hypothetical protein